MLKVLIRFICKGQINNVNVINVVREITVRDNYHTDSCGLEAKLLLYCDSIIVLPFERLYYL
jgi:hypothetical protein